MQDATGKRSTFDWIWFLFFAVASSLWCWTAASKLGATFDEPIYIQRGLDFWHTGSHAGLMQLGTMPLPVDVVTLPLYVWERWHGVAIDPTADLSWALPWARRATLVFWWGLLIYAWVLGRELGGVWGGRLAVALLACEPTFLAHASLATTDIAVTACLTALTYHFHTGRSGGWLNRIGWPALWLGLATLAKASGLVFGCLCLAAYEMGRLVYEARSSGKGFFPLDGWRASWKLLFQIGLCSLVVSFVLCGCDWRPQPSFVEWARKLPAGPKHEVMVWLAEHLRIFSNAGEGIVRQFKHNVRGHGTYLLGEVYPRAVWYYFPVALSIKLALSLLALPILVFFTRLRALANVALLLALFLLAFSLTCRVQIGVRLVLPLIAFFEVGVAVAAARAWLVSDGEVTDFAPPPRVFRWIGTLAVLSCVLWSVGTAAQVWPHGLGYANEAWGGTGNAYRLVSDSNYDWGQGLPELAAWQRTHADAPLGVWYFGSDPAIHQAPFLDMPLHAYIIHSSNDLQDLLRGKYLAVGMSILHGSVQTTLKSAPPEVLEAFEQSTRFLHKQRPIARTQTFLIYDFRTPGGRPAGSLSAAR